MAPVDAASVGVAIPRKIKPRTRKKMNPIEKIDAIFSSDLKRAKDTTHEIVKFHNIPIHYTVEIRERKMGIFEGKHEEEFFRTVDESKLPRTQYKPEGGESFVEVKKRAQDFINKLFKNYKGKTVLVVSHGGFIKMMLGILEA